MKVQGRLILAILMLLSFATTSRAAELYRFEIDQRTTSMFHCQIYESGIEPSALLTFSIKGRKMARRIYSDLCTHSSEWIHEIFINDNGDIVGLSGGNSHSKYISVTDLWMSRSN